MFGKIEFYNAEHKINARGTINRDGTVTVSTYDEDDGAVVGNHQIMISQQTSNHLTANIKAPIDHDHGDLVDPKYFDYRTSGLSCTIEPGSNEIELQVSKSK